MDKIDKARSLKKLLDSHGMAYAAASSRRPFRYGDHSCWPCCTWCWISLLDARKTPIGTFTAIKWHDTYPAMLMLPMQVADKMWSPTKLTIKLCKLLVEALSDTEHKVDVDFDTNGYDSVYLSERLAWINDWHKHIELL